MNHAQQGVLMTSRTRAAFAIAVMVAGVILVWRGLGRFGPGRPPTPATTAVVSNVPPPLANPTEDPFDLPLERAVTADSLPALEEEARAQISAQLRTRLADQRADPLSRISAEMLRTIASGSFDDYTAFVERHGGRLRPGPLTDEERQQFKTFHESIAPAYAMRPLSIKGIQVRARVLQGRNVPQTDFEAKTGMVYAESRYPALQPHATSTEKGHVITGDTYEVLVPIGYSYEGAEMSMMLGLWMTWAPESKEWLPSRIMYYVPSSTRSAVVLPPY